MNKRLRLWGDQTALFWGRWNTGFFTQCNRTFWRAYFGRRLTAQGNHTFWRAHFGRRLTAQGNPSLDVADIYDIDMLSLPRADLIVAGFPCQAFSVAGKRQGFQDARGQVFFRLAEIIEHVRPSWLLLENVKNLQTHNKGQMRRFESFGYALRFQVLNTMTHTDIPQNRERIFIVGALNRCLDTFAFPPPAETRRDIRELLDACVDESFYYSMRFAMYPTLVTEMTDAEAIYQWRRHHVRKNKKNVVPTLTCNMGTGGHGRAQCSTVIGCSTHTQIDTT